MQTAVITFPGSNCDRDMYVALKATFAKEPMRIWHAETSLPKGIDLIAIPGGFSYGDYLRSGAIAARSPIMREVVAAANGGTYVLGVCNGFQILTETGLLPGTLLRNCGLKFICKTVSLKVTSSGSDFTKQYKPAEVINIPIAHHDGNYFASGEVLKELEENERVAFRYSDGKGNTNNDSNPNGSLHNIAGIFSSNKRILGMMPHPERAIDSLTGSAHGQKLFDGLV